jgi:hypothetical protein
MGRRIEAAGLRNTWVGRVIEGMYVVILIDGLIDRSL